MAKTPLHKKNARRKAAGLPPLQSPLKHRLPFDADHFVLTQIVALHKAKDPRVPAGWAPPQASCPNCHVSGPLHTCDREFLDGTWRSVCPGCGQPLPSTP